MSEEIESIKTQLKELRALPIGMQEFEDWSDRIVSGSCLPADAESQKYALAQMLLHLGPTTDHESDLYFIKSLRKSAINQIADAKCKEIQARVKARLKAKEEETQGEVTAATNADTSNGEKA